MTGKNRIWILLKQYGIITAATFVFAVGISLFLDPNNLAPGGVSGIAIILSRFIPAGTGSLIMAINIPIIFLGIWKLGWKLMIPTFYAIVLSSLFTDLLAPFGAVISDPLLSALTGGALIALGIGFIFKIGATTGGTDIIVRLLKLRFPHLKTGFLFFLVDVIVVAASGIVFGDLETALYAGLAVITNAIIMDLVLYGPDGAKLVYIISDNTQEIGIAYMEILGLGVTYLEGRGAFSKKEKQVLMCVMRKTDFPKAEGIVKEIDPDSFLIVTNATEIIGEGYRNIFADRI